MKTKVKISCDFLSGENVRAAVFVGSDGEEHVENYPLKAGDTVEVELTEKSYISIAEIPLQKSVAG
jgi:positive regulator of sigma E activity